MESGPAPFRARLSPTRGVIAEGRRKRKRAAVARTAPTPKVDAPIRASLGRLGCPLSPPSYGGRRRASSFGGARFVVASRPRRAHFPPNHAHAVPRCASRRRPRTTSSRIRSPPNDGGVPRPARTPSRPARARSGTTGSAVCPAPAQNQQFFIGFFFLLQ